MKRKVTKYLLIVLTCLPILAGCRQKSPDPETYRAEIEAWHAQRLDRLKAPEGWLNLAGLFWLQEGLNTFGSDTSNSLVFPDHAPAFIGAIECKGDSLYLRSASERVMINNTPAGNIKLRDDASGKPDIMRLDSLAWFIIKRGGKYGIRLRDYASPLISNLTGIPCFETDERWRIMAEFKPYAIPVKHTVQTIIGTDEEYLVPGELHFRTGGKKLTLYPFDDHNGFFIVFGDETNGNETYPAGRFLYTGKPDDQNRVFIDFNKAYNPPCAFTPYATCPLPLRKNILPAAVEAGEKAVHLYSQFHN